MVERNCEPCSRKSLAYIVKPSMYLARAAGLTPMSIKETQSGQYTVTATSRAVKSCTIIFLFTYFTTYFGHGWLYRQYEDLYLFSYLIIRMFIIMLTHLSFLLNHKYEEELLRIHLDFDVYLPSLCLPVPLILYVIYMTVIFTTHFAAYGALGIGVVICASVFPGFVCIYPCFLYICQMLVLRSKVQNLSKDLSDFTTTAPPEGNLREILSRHAILRDICCRVNEAYGAPLLLITLVEYVEAIYCLFTLCVVESPVMLTCLITWISTRSIPPVAAMLASQQVENAVEEMRAIATQTKLISPALSHETQEQMVELEVQLKQLPLRFTANGFFDLSGVQVRIIIATIITYTVILLQNTQRPVALRFLQKNLGTDVSKHCTR